MRKSNSGVKLAAAAKGTKDQTLAQTYPGIHVRTAQSDLSCGSVSSGGNLGLAQIDLTSSGDRTARSDSTWSVETDKKQGGGGKARCRASRTIPAEVCRVGQAA